MKTVAVDAAIAAANPVPLGEPRSAALDAAGAQMLAAIMAGPASATATRATHRNRKRHWVSTLKARRVHWITASAASIAVAFVLVMTVAGGGGTGGGTPAFAASLIRYAESTPLLALELPGWHTVDAIEDSPEEGELHYLPDGAPESDYADQAELHWRTGTLSRWDSDRAASSDFSTVATVLGAQAKVFRYKGGTQAASSFTALWLDDGQVIEFRATVHDLAAFEQMLDAIHQVDATTWLSALPASVITSAEDPETIRTMLEGVPLPPGFQASQINEIGLAQDRYQVGATVAGTVACEWIKRWMEGQSSGNPSEVQEAIGAMATSSQWPVLRSMESQGAYPQVLEEYAAAMTRGTWYGRPLGGDANSGLGCATKGVALPLDESERSYGRGPDTLRPLRVR